MKERRRNKKEVHQRKIQGDYQTARVAYANCPWAVFGFLGATAEEAGGADAYSDAKVSVQYNVQWRDASD